jgi:hypothetical protein
MTDARFEDGAERPLLLAAATVEDLAVISALVQDALAEPGEMAWMRRHRRFSVLLKRFRWEDRDRAARAGRGFERVQSVLSIEDVTHVSAAGIRPGQRDTILSLLALEFRPGEDGTGRLLITCAGDGDIAVDVESINVTLADVSRPYVAPSGKAPEHQT